MNIARAIILCVPIVLSCTVSATGQVPKKSLTPPPVPKNAGLSIVPGVEPVPPPKAPTEWMPEKPAPEETAPHLKLIPQWYPSPPPANYTTSSCNFNVWCGEERFSPDFSTYQVLMGGYTTMAGFGPLIPDFTYIPVSFRCGWMLNAPQDTEAFYRGNMEVLFDFTLAAITSGIGTAFGGPSVIGRYNFVQPNAHVVPYIQGGAGFVLTDANRDRWQRAIGQGFEFYLRAEIGVRCFLSDNWSLDIEGGYHHISNANMATRNYGVNALGGQIGLTYFFPSGGR